MAGCSGREGHACVADGDCGDGLVCSFGAPGGLESCAAQGVCIQRSRCFGESLYQPRPSVSAEVFEFGLCGCDGQVHEGNVVCPSWPIVGVGLTACTCTGVSVTNLHRGPRSTRDPCSGTDGSLAPANCCDCSLAVSSATSCGTASGQILPAACCDCFSSSSPDPTGRCGPPGGTWPASDRWCCPAPEMVLGPDAG